MKYIDADKLKEEIQANLAAISFNDDYQEGYEACGMSVLKFIDSLQQEQQESPSLVEKAIVWFNNIAESAKRLSAGNVSHLGPTIAGMAIRSEEFLEKHKQEQPEQPTRGYDEAYLNDCIARAKKSWEGVDVDRYMDMVRGKEPVDKGLEEAADNFAHCYDQGTCDGIAQDCFIAGAEWDREQMMKGAVEGEIVDSGFDDGTAILKAIVPDRRYDSGDKVKLIVIKED